MENTPEDKRNRTPPYSHFSFCPLCGVAYKTWGDDMVFKCYRCKKLIKLTKHFPKETLDNPSSRVYWIEWRKFIGC